MMSKTETNTFWNRILSFVLVAVMLLGLLPSNMFITASAAWSGYADYNINVSPTGTYTIANKELATYTTNDPAGNRTIRDITVSGGNGYKTMALTADHDLGVHNGTKWDNANITGVIAPIKPILDLYFWVTETKSGHDADTWSADWTDTTSKTVLGLAQTALWNVRTGTITDLNDVEQVRTLAADATKAITALGVTITENEVMSLIESIMASNTTIGREINSNFEYYLITPDSPTETSLLIPYFTDATVTTRNVYISFENLDSETKQPLADSVYNIYDSNGMLVAEAISTTSQKTVVGPIAIENENDIFTVVQTNAPDGYLANNYGTVAVNSYINISAEAAAIVSGSPFYNEKGTPSTTHDVTLLKLDQYGNGLDGAKFDIYKDNVFIKTDTTTNGKIVLTDVTSGVYRFTETAAPSGYILDTDNTVRINVDTTGAATNHIITKINYNVPAIEIIKTDKVTKKSVAGAVFTVEIGDRTIGDYSTNANGMTRVPYADYAYLLKESDNTWEVKVTEKTPPANYFSEGGTNTLTYTMTRSKTMSVFVFENYAFFGLDISKYKNGTTELVNGAKFSVYVDGVKVANGETGANGEQGTLSFGPNFFGNILENTRKTSWEIKVVEDSSPVGYDAAIPTEQTQTIQISRNENVQFSFGNAQHPELIIYRTDDNGNPLAGSKFSIAVDDKVVTSVTTDETGYAIIDALTFGLYLGNDATTWDVTVTETSAPSGYLISENPVQTQQIIKGQSSVEFFYTSAKFPTITINKTDLMTGNPLKDAKFEIYFDDNLFDTRTTDEKGQILLSYYDSTNEQGYAVKGYGDFIATLSDTFKLDWSVTIKEIEVPDTYLMPENDSQTIALNLNTPAEPVNFVNSQFSDIKIHLTDVFTDKPIQGAEFAVRVNMNIDATVDTTDADGMVTIPAADYIKYIPAGADEIFSVEVHQLTNTPEYFTPEDKDLMQATLGNKSKELDVFEFTNEPLPDVIAKAITAKTGEPISGVTFTLTGSLYGSTLTATTDASGTARFKSVPMDIYTLTQTSVPRGYILSEQAEQFPIWFSEDGKPQMISYEFETLKVPVLTIKKTDSVTGDPIQGIVFSIKYKANAADTDKDFGSFTTDANGEIVFTNSGDLQEGFYTITELSPLSGYAYSAEGPTKTIQLNAGDDYTHSVTNTPLSALIVRKIDATTGKPVEGATFEITYFGASTNTNGTIIKTAKTSANGTIVIPGLQAGHYSVQEISPADGYEISSPSLKTVYMSGRNQDNVEVLFGDAAKGLLNITKLDSITKKPLSGAQFQVTDANGSPIGNSNGIYTTDENGMIEISEHLNVGATITVKELSAPDGYVLDTIAQNVKIKENTTSNLTFYNTPMGSLIIIKRDSATGATLAGAQFKITNAAGEFVGQTGGTNASNGIYTTDANGMITITGLTETNYIVTEVTAPDGYNLDSVSQTVNLKLNDTQTLTFYNTPKSGIQILKRDVDTKAPLANAEFTIYKADGSIAGVYTTDKDGLIALDGLKPGWYKAVESKAPAGYLRDDTPKDFQITNNQEMLLIFENVMLPGLRILKVDSVSKEPIEGVQFRVYTNNQTDFIGVYTTDENGIINVTDLKAGIYQIQEVQPAEGYIADNSFKTIEVKPNSTANITIENTKAAGIVIYKVDSITGDPLPNAQFTLSDQNHNPVGQYTTDDQGRIIIDDKDFTAGRYYLRETRAPEGYNIDPQERTITLEKGKTTTITWENTARTGTIQILKRSGAAHANTGTPAGAYLEGAVFGVYNYSTGKLVTTLTSGSNGWAISSAIPLGTYVIKETSAPAGYRLSTEELKVTLSTQGQVLKFEVLNYPSNLRVSINKAGVQTATSNSNIMYTFYDIRNMSTVSLDNFYWRDVLPTDVLRANYITTGTYNTYKVYNVSVTTNYDRDFIVASNLSTTVNNHVDLRGAAIGLKEGEYVTSYKLNFGTVPSGFTQVTAPQLECYVLSGLQSNIYFVNKADAGGQSNGEWTVANTTWGSTTYNPNPPKAPNYPQTGY